MKKFYNFIFDKVLYQIIVLLVFRKRIILSKKIDNNTFIIERIYQQGTSLIINLSVISGLVIVKLGSVLSEASASSSRVVRANF